MNPFSPSKAHLAAIALLALAAALAMALNSCGSRKLAKLYDPTYVEQLEAESSNEDLTLPPGLSHNTSDEFAIPGKISQLLEEYESIFSIFSDNRNFAFRTDGKGEYWLTSRADPASLWVGLKEFFRIEGLEINYENVAVGEMRTGWAENLARNRFHDAVFHHADRYLVQLLPSSETGWVNVHVRHQGALRDLRAVAEAREKAEGEDGIPRPESGAGKRDEIVEARLRARAATWQPSPSESRLALEMLTRIAIFLGSSPEKAKELRRKHVTGVLGRIYLERSEFGDISLVIGDSQARAWLYTRRALDSLEQFGRIGAKGKPDRLSFSIRSHDGLDAALPEDLYLSFNRHGERIKLLLYDQQENIVNPLLAEALYRMLAKALRPKYVEIEMELYDTRIGPSVKQAPSRR